MQISDKTNLNGATAENTGDFSDALAAAQPATAGPGELRAAIMEQNMSGLEVKPDVYIPSTNDEPKKPSWIPTVALGLVGIGAGIGMVHNHQRAKRASDNAYIASVSGNEDLAERYRADDKMFTTHSQIFGAILGLSVSAAFIFEPSAVERRREKKELKKLEESNNL